MRSRDADLNVFRPPSHFVHGPNAEVVILPQRIAAWLERHARLNELRVEVRGADAEVDAVLAAIRLAALAYRTAVCGTDQGKQAEGEQPSVMSTQQVADQLHLHPRTIRLAIAEKRLRAEQVDGRWRVTREDFEHYRAARAA